MIKLVPNKATFLRFGRKYESWWWYKQVDIAKLLICQNTWDTDTHACFARAHTHTHTQFSCSARTRRRAHTQRCVCKVCKSK